MLDLGTMQFAARCEEREHVVEEVAKAAFSGDTELTINTPDWFDITDWDYVAERLYDTYGIDLYSAEMQEFVWNYLI